ncbi:MAG: chemotaxis protein CheW [Phormidium sp.]
MLILIFHIGSSLYAIDSYHVIEVIPRVTYREVAYVPKYVAGLFNYRGAIVPVIDLCQLLRGTPSKPYLSTRVIMVSYPGKDNRLQYIGLMAERVIKTMNKPEIEFVNSGIQADQAAYLGGMMMDEKGMIQRIDIDRLFAELKPVKFLGVGNDSSSN